MTRDNVKNRLALAVNAAAKTIPNLAKRHVPPHTIRHTTAMHSLQSGADICVNRAAAFWRAKRLNERTLPIIQWNVQCRLMGGQFEQIIVGFGHFRASDDGLVSGIPIFAQRPASKIWP